ncbi:hypothetical protein JTE90_002516 [Oedothorax gibbosus]|uniref:Uncharacterized protein n=1 Tax=Oedothorax gibbosus TaxID=931172 RepID=A0AAV6TJV5_9ARAC|nr:hypothetical protein JTE90_002516 [Oedothorax gibbosus]
MLYPTAQHGRDALQFFHLLLQQSFKCLQEEHPEVNQKFKAGNFVVRQSKRPFTAVSPDMKLEQTIQRSQKSSNGIIGQRRQQMYVTEWELMYHEVLGVSNSYREILGVDSSGYRVRGNPYESSIKSLFHNFINSTCVPREDAVCMLKVEEHGGEAYENEIRLPTMERKIIFPNVKSQTAQATQNKSIATADRSIHIAKARGETMKDILKYDLLPTSMLLNSSGYTSKPIKHVLLSEIEKKLDQEQNCFHLRDDTDTAVVVDLMSQIRQLKTKEMQTFKN